MRFLLEKVSPDMWKFPVLSGRKEYLGLGVAGRALAAAGLAGAVGAGARGVGAGHFGRCLGGLGRKVMCFGRRSLMLDDLLQVSVSAKGKAIFIPLLTLAERSPLQSSTSTSGLGKNEIGCMGDCISKRKSPSQYPYSGLGLAHSTCLDLHVTGVAVFGPTGRYTRKRQQLRGRLSLRSFAAAE